MVSLVTSRITTYLVMRGKRDGSAYQWTIGTVRPVKIYTTF